MVVGTDGAAHKKPVELGIQDGDDVQITKGLTTTTWSSPTAPMDSTKAPR